MNIGQKIKFHRKKKNITQKQLAEMIGKSKSSIEKYEAGQILPPINVIDDIAKALNINDEDLWKNSFEIDSSIDKEDLAEILNISIDTKNKDEINKLNKTKEIIDNGFKEYFDLIEKGELHKQIHDPADIESVYSIYVARMRETYITEIHLYRGIIDKYKRLAEDNQEIINSLMKISSNK